VLLVTSQRPGAAWKLPKLPGSYQIQDNQLDLTWMVVPTVTPTLHTDKVRTTLKATIPLNPYGSCIQRLGKPNFY
jgi:hypothetical protein